MCPLFGKKESMKPLVEEAGLGDMVSLSLPKSFYLFVRFYFTHLCVFVM